MGPKKKGKGSKLAKMSDEERARYLQHRAAIEEEARRRKEQLISTFMKNKLKKEETFSRLNAAKINQQWRQTLRVLKCTELKQDLDALHHWFEHTANKKTQLIDCLLGDLQEAENQYSRIHQCHMETIDRLLAIYNGRINILQASFEKERDQMFLRARGDVEEMVQFAVYREEHLHAIIFRMQQTSDEKTAKAVAAHNICIDELRNHMLTELENLVNRREARMETLWTSFQGVLQNHWSQTEDRRREYLNLRDTDADNCSHIFHYHQQINALNEVLQGLKNQLTSDNSTINDRVAERQADNEGCMELFHVLRQKLKTEQGADKKKLCYMTDVAQGTTKHLEKIFSKGTQILQLLNLCKKLETENEKICPGGLPTPEGEKLLPKESPQCKETLAQEALKKFSKLNNFWKRYNQVLIEKEALNLHCQALIDEQRKLKYVLKQYFNEFSTSQALPKAPLMIHRPATSVSRKQMGLKGQKVIPRAGKIDVYSDECTPFMHMLTIELTKSA